MPNVNQNDVFIKGIVGPGGASPDNTTTVARFGRENDTVTSNLHGFYFEQASRGRLFCLNLPVTTTGVAAGNVTGAAAAASTNFAIWNPTGSGKNLSLIKFAAGIVSGTIVGGPMIYNIGVGNPTIASTLTNGSLTNLAFNGLGGVAKGVAVAAGTALTGGPAITAFRNSAMAYSAGTYAALAGTLAFEQFDGDMIVPPGFLWVPCFAAAGTTVLSSYSLVFEEVAI